MSKVKPHDYIILMVTGKVCPAASDLHYLLISHKIDAMHILVDI